MFYRPNFCCHCGEKIVRARWTLLTSRRFCEFCAVEQQQHDLLPRAAFVVVVLFGAAAMTAYLAGGRTSRSTAPIVSAEARSSSHPERSSSSANAPSADHGRPSSLTVSNSAEPNSNISSANTKQRAGQPLSSTEPVYYCGAMTKKGTACTRRVKVPGRCWQHIGQPAMSTLR